MHSQATTRPSRNGSMASRKARGGGQILVQEDVALGIEDAEVHRSGVQVDAAVGLMLLLVEPHHGPPSSGRAAWWALQCTAGNGRRREEAMMSILALQRTRPAAAAFWYPRGSSRRAGPLSLGDYEAGGRSSGRRTVLFRGPQLLGGIGRCENRRRMHSTIRGHGSTAGLIHPIRPAAHSLGRTPRAARGGSRRAIKAPS